MTTNVPKGAGRASHKARTEKAAQRTPLPPKKAPGKAPRSTPTAAKKSEPSRAARKSTAPATPSEEPRPKKAARVAPKPAKGAPSTPVPEKAGKSRRSQPSHATDAPSAPSLPSGLHPKIVSLVEYAIGAGWKAEVTEPIPGKSAIVTATREDEAIDVMFINGVLDTDQMPTYTIGQRTVKLRNVSAAKKQMEVPPQEALKVAASVSVRRERKVRDKDEEGQPRELSIIVPWDNESTDEEILEFVKGRRIIWRNSVSGTYDEASVFPHGMKKHKHLQIVESRDGRKVLNWASVEGGFRSVFIDAIVQVR